MRSVEAFGTCVKG